MIISHEGDAEVYTGIDFDYSLSTAPVINSSVFELSTKGLFFATAKGELEPAGVVAPAMPAHDDSKAADLMQAFISDYTLDSLASAFLVTNPYAFWIKSTDVPAASPFKLDTTDLSIFFPGLSAKYGAGLPMLMELNIRDLSKFKSTEASKTMSLHTDLDIQFYVNKTDGTQEMAVDILLKDLFFDCTASIDSMNLHPQIVSASLDNIVQIASTVGTLDLSEITALFQQILAAALPPINTAISGLTLAIPDKLFGLFGLSELQLIYHDDYIEALVKPQFIAQGTKFVPKIPEF